MNKQDFEIFERSARRWGQVALAFLLCCIILGFWAILSLEARGQQYGPPTPSEPCPHCRPWMPPPGPPQRPALLIPIWGPGPFIIGQIPA